MSKRRSGNLCTIILVIGTAAVLAACSHAEAVLNQNQKPAEGTAQAAAPAVAATPPAPPMTREQASTDCWMKYEKEGRHLSLDQRLPLVEKCTAEKLKAASR